MSDWRREMDYPGAYDNRAQAQVLSNYDQLRQVEDREKDMHKLETNIVQLHDIHRELATIVGEQGQIIDSIENNVQHTDQQVQKSVQQTTQAVRYQTAARRKKIFCGTCVAVVIVIVIIVVIVIVKK